MNEESIKKFTAADFDADALAEQVRLRLSDVEKQSFLDDMCDMANYVSERLFESRDGSLVIGFSAAKNASELREDEPKLFERAEEILANAPHVKDGYIAVPQIMDNGEN